MMGRICGKGAVLTLELKRVGMVDGASGDEGTGEHR